MSATRLVGSIPVALIAENRLLREALTKILNTKNGMHVVASFPFSSRALQLVAAAGPQVLLADADTLASSGGQIIPDALVAIPDLKVIMVAMEADPDKFLRVVRSGAVGYVLKDASATEMESAVRAVVEGKAVCPPRLCLTLFDHFARQSKQVPGFFGKLQFGLTSREQELITMLGRGLRNKEIANEVHVSDQTVKHHVHHVLRKLGANDRLEAVEVCRLHGMPV
jgi:DNA-binding NarL/FixJ family response regulator